MKTLLDSQNIAYFIGDVSQLTDVGVYLNDESLNQQFNTSNATLTDLLPPNPYLNGVWQLSGSDWVCINQAAVDNYNETKRQEFNAEQSKKRFAAYTTESDPIFFKSQRGEATNQEWLDAIAAIDARFPYQE